MDFSVAGEGIGRRFQIVSVLPTFVLVAAIWFMFATGAWSTTPDANRGAQRLGDITLGGAALLVLGVVALSLVMHPFQVRLVKILEGYAPPWSPLRRYGLARHARRVHHLRRVARRLSETERAIRKALADAGTASDAGRLTITHERRRAYEQQANAYPPPDRLMSTLLGNRLRYAEDQAGARYGIKAVSFFPYLYATMPAHHTIRVADARNEMDMAARFSITFLVLTLAAFAAFADDSWWLLVPVALYLLAWLSYRGAVAAAVVYGSHLSRAIDLYRFTVLDAMAIPRPADAATEKATFEELGLPPRSLRRRKVSKRLKYSHPSSSVDVVLK